MQGPRVIVDICYNREIVTSGMATGHHELEQILCSTSEDARIGGHRLLLSLPVGNKHSRTKSLGPYCMCIDGRQHDLLDLFVFLTSCVL
jgi:hypothetical protein